MPKFDVLIERLRWESLNVEVEAPHAQMAAILADREYQRGTYDGCAGYEWDQAELAEPMDVEGCELPNFLATLIQDGIKPPSPEGPDPAPAPAEAAPPGSASPAAACPRHRPGGG